MKSESQVHLVLLTTTVQQNSHTGTVEVTTPSRFVEGLAADEAACSQTNIQLQKHHQQHIP